MIFMAQIHTHVVIVIRCGWPSAKEAVKIVLVWGRVGGGGCRISGKKGGRGKGAGGTVGRASR